MNSIWLSPQSVHLNLIYMIKKQERLESEWVVIIMHSGSGGTEPMEKKPVQTILNILYICIEIVVDLEYVWRVCWLCI